MIRGRLGQKIYDAERCPECYVFLRVMCQSCGKMARLRAAGRCALLLRCTSCYRSALEIKEYPFYGED